MASSDITVAGLTVTPTVRGNELAWTYIDPRSGSLPNIGLDAVEVHASTTNDRTTATKVGEGTTNFTHAGLLEEATWYYWIKARNRIGNYGAWYPSGSTSGVSAMVAGMSGVAFTLANGKLVASVSSNLLTIAIKTAAGNDPSVADPVFVAFRNATLTAGNYIARAITAALSFGPFSGTFGTTNATPFRLWVVLFDDGGTLRLAACTMFGTSFPPSGLASASVTGGISDSLDRTLLANANITQKPFRVLGYMDWASGLTTAGTWDATPTTIQLMAPGISLPGEEILFFEQTDISYVSGTTTVPLDDTIPQSGEGNQIFSTAYSPAAGMNLLDVECKLDCSHSVAATAIVALFRDSGANALRADWADVPAANAPTQVVLRHRFNFASASTTTIKIRAGASAAGTFAVNGASGARLLGGVMGSLLRLREIQG